jgi:hypothetical protein
VQAQRGSSKATLDIALFAEDPIVVEQPDGTVLYRGKYLQTAIEKAEAATGASTITLNDTITLDADVKVTKSIQIQGAAKLKSGNGHLKLTTVDAQIIADASLGSMAVSAVTYYQINTVNADNKYTYKLTPIAPTIEAPVVTRGEVIRGYRVDTKNKYLYLDVSPDGLTKEQFVNLVGMKANNAKTAKAVIQLTGTATYKGNTLIATGTKIKATAQNGVAADAVLEYTVIILGDTNCDGRITSGDAVLMAKDYTGVSKMSGLVRLAADVTCDGKLNSGDAVRNATKYTYLWKSGKYTSALK